MGSFPGTNKRDFWFQKQPASKAKRHVATASK